MPAPYATVRRGLRTVAQIEAVDGPRVVVVALRNRLAGAALTSYLRRIYPDATPQSLAAYVRYGQRVLAATQAAPRAPGFSYLNPPTGPGNPNLPAAIRYTVAVRVFYASGRAGRILVTIDSNDPLQKAVLYNRAVRLAGGFVGATYYEGQGEQITGVDAGTREVIYVENR